MTCCFFSLIVRLPALRSVSLLCTPLRGLRTHHQLQCSAVADVIKEDSPRAVAELQKEGVFVYSIEQVEGSTKLQNLQLDTDRRYAVVFGNEVKGVHQEVVDMSDGCLEIPQFGTKHSLNVSVTAGMVIWEVAKKFLEKL